VKNFVGLDVGKKNIEAVRIFENEKIQRFKCTTGPKGVASLIEWLDRKDHVAIEAGTITFYLARKIMEHDIKVTVLNAAQLAMIYNSKKKTDKEDALKLARLLARNPVEELPFVKIPSLEEEEKRALVNERSFYVTARTKYINRIHGILASVGIVHVTKTMLGNRANRKKVLDASPLSAQKRIARLCESLESTESLLEGIDQEVKETLRANPEYSTIAMSLPGVGPVATLTFMAYLGDCSQFQKSTQACAYAGLTPRINSSGETTRMGSIRPGCKAIRKIIMQTAWAIVRCDMEGPLRQFYQRTHGQIGKKKAAVAVARKTIETFYHMIRKKETYWGSDYDMISRKLKRTLSMEI